MSVHTHINIELPIPIWCNIFDSVIQPIALYGSEVWGPISDQSYTRWDRHPIESPTHNILQTCSKTAKENTL